MQVPFFNYPALFKEYEEEFIATFTDVGRRGAYIMQNDLFDFEQELSQYLGVRHALGVADGTVALTISLKLAGIKPGDEVIVPSHTFIATAAAVHHVGAVPVICDCGPDHEIDIDSATSLVTGKTKAIMPVQLNGRCCDMHGVKKFADEYGLKIVEDSCQALGARFDNRFAGTFGVAGSFSFYPAKVLGCFGDGGAVIVDCDDLARQAREYRDHGRDEKSGLVTRFGHNGRLDNVQAAFLRIKLRDYDKCLARRRQIAAIYHERLSEIEQLLLPPAPDSDNLRFDIYQNYEIEAEKRDELRQFLADRDIGTIMQWGGNVIHQFKDLNLRHNAAYAEEMSKKFLMLPLHHLLEDDEVHYVSDAIAEFYNH